MVFAEKMILAVFSVCIKSFLLIQFAVNQFMSIILKNSWYLQMLIVLWMTRNITDDIPGWGSLFDGRVGDGTASVSIEYSVINKF